jgi:trk system potassium uptake protein
VAGRGTGCRRIGQDEFVFRVRKRSVESSERADEREAMRIGIAGAGAVGRSVAQELLAYGHKVLLIEHNAGHYEPHTVPDADWLWADACELSSLEESGMQTCDVVIAATGDDKVNLTAALLAKTEFGVARVVARVNDMRNEWLFTEAWGVDVAVCTPRTMVASIEGAIDIGHLVQLMELRQGQASLAKLTLPDDSPLVGRRVRDLALPENTALAVVIRDGGPIVPKPDDVLDAADELLFFTGGGAEHQARALVRGAIATLHDRTDELWPHGGSVET